MGVAGVLIVLLILLVIGIWLTSHLVGLIVMLFIAGIIGWIADQIVPGRLPYGWLGAIVAGLVGSWIGSLILGGLVLPWRVSRSSRHCLGRSSWRSSRAPSPRPPAAGSCSVRHD